MSGLTTIKSVEKALSLLECFSIQEPELGISDMAKKMGVPKSSAHSLVATFCEAGYLKRTSSGRYSLDIKILRFAYIVNQNLGYPRAVYDILMETANKTKQVVYFGVPYEQSVLYLYVAHPMDRMEELPYREITGEIAPLYSTGIGKAILAHLPPEEWNRRMPAILTARTPKTITDRADMVAELKAIRDRGFSIDNQENERGIRCVGVPVYSATGQLVAGISTSGPVERMTEKTMRECLTQLRVAATKMKDRIYR